MNIGENIAFYRKAAGLKQLELAALIGVSAQAVSKWENGGTPDVTLIPGIAKALNVPIGKLFGEEEAAPEWREAAARELVLKDKDHMTGNIAHFNWYLQKHISAEFASAIRNVDYMDEAKDRQYRRRFAVSLSEDGLILHNLLKENPISLAMPEPRDGYLSKLSSEEEFQKIFQTLGKGGRLKVLFWMYSQNRPVIFKKIQKDLAMPFDLLSASLNDLVSLGLLSVSEAEDEEGLVKIYASQGQYMILPVLYFLDSLRTETADTIIRMQSRERALFSAALKDAEKSTGS